MNTNKKGNIGLVKSMMELTLHNYFIFLPISDTTCVDLVVGNDKMELKRLQIKYISLKNGKLEISTKTVVNGKKIPVNLEMIDMWIIYCPDNEKLYYINCDELKGKSTKTIRVMKPKKMSNTVTMADKYENILNAW